jgi:hypothetical protein
VAATSPVEKPVRASPINDTVIFIATPDREARLQLRELPASEHALPNVRLRAE